MMTLFRRDYLLRLPLPLAQLYSRAFNAKDARARHDNGFYLFEALIKLAAIPLVASYLENVKQGGGRGGKIDRVLLKLALPAQGQCVQILRELAAHIASLPDAATHALGHVQGQLEKRHELPGLINLYRRIKNGPDGEPAADKTCSLLELFEVLVRYRNLAFGHGAAREESFYEREMGPLLTPAVNEVLREDLFSPLGPKGSELVYITEVRKISDEHYEAQLRELIGTQGERSDPIELTAAQAALLSPYRVALLWPGRKIPLRLDPLLAYRESGVNEEVLFLN